MQNLSIMFESNHRRLWLGGTVLIGSMLGLLIALPWFPMASSGKTVQLEFLRSEPDQALLFFGFPGCGEICPIAMERLHAIKSNGGFPVPIQVGLVNIAAPAASDICSDHWESGAVWLAESQPLLYSPHPRQTPPIFASVCALSLPPSSGDDLHGATY